MKLSEKYNAIQEKAKNSLKKESDSEPVYNKQIFHAFLFNIRNYSPQVINIQQRKVEFNYITKRE